ncbi:putative Receptor protein kinase [Quillaja saponaria]|uniref:non-specific serine/threonine protein kinase n=1 Tax=Quillaja saponaria TaxID=32244 RepID=A0AAD7PKW1_QUISA|nr:putative Receptor protein kinase [Quillaja saponaria]
MAKCNKITCHWLLILSIFPICFIPSFSDDGNTDAKILIKFKSYLSNDTALNNWKEAIAPCNGDANNWFGLICVNNTIFGLRLENIGLMGVIDIDTLMELSKFRSLSVMNNSFDGPMPNVNKLVGLKALFLSANKFSGEIRDDAFNGMKYLKKVYLAENEFTGHVPQSLVDLPQLIELSLEGNRFEGHIPDFKQKEIRVLNLANNQFEGPIPESLSNVDPSNLAGNKGLCGKPLEPCKSSKKHTNLIIAITVVAVAALAIIIIALSFLFFGRLAQTSEYKVAQDSKAQNKFQNYNTGLKEAHPNDLPDDFKKENGDLHFVRKDKERFDLHELLRASAEILGSGSFGSTYKAVLLNGPSMVVKRFKQMNNVGREEFHEYMKRLGRLSHPNLLPLVAFYYRKEEKLLIYDYAENGSLASHLHARRGLGEAGLDWPTRLKIIKGVARGLAYLYKEFPTQMLPHGHLKSSNVVLDHAFEPRLTEYALVQVINKNHAQQYMAAYKSPEVTQYDRTTKKTDVWCLGILILELLTGRFPANYLRHGKGNNADLATWVNSVVREEWTGEVFDKEIKKSCKNGEGEMLKLLKIGMCCCEWGVEGRWDWREAVGKIEELERKG